MLDDEQSSDKALLVLVNKQDAPGAIPCDEVTELLGLQAESDVRPQLIQATSATSGTGLVEGLDWLAKQMT